MINLGTLMAARVFKHGFLGVIITQLSHPKQQHSSCNAMCLKGWCLGNSSSTTYEIKDLLRKHGGKTAEELKAEGN